MGRPRKALETNKKHFTKAERESRAASEQAFRVPRDQLLDFDGLGEVGLSEEGITEYRRLATLAVWLDDLDRNDLINYCICWERARALAISPDARREVLQVTGSMGNRKIIRNPYVSAWADYTAQMRAISLKLGLAQVDRLKLVAPMVEEQKTNKFVQLILKKGQRM